MMQAASSRLPVQHQVQRQRQPLSSSSSVVVVGSSSRTVLTADHNRMQPAAARGRCCGCLHTGGISSRAPAGVQPSQPPPVGSSLFLGGGSRRRPQPLPSRRHPQAAATDASSSSGSDQQQQPTAPAAAAAPAPQPPPPLDLPPLDLPPSRSAALWLAGLSEQQLQQAAADWGYDQVGVPLPEGVSLPAIAETLPDSVYELSLPKALGYLGLSLAVMAAGYSYLIYWHSICPLWQQVLAWAVIGTGYFGAFQTAVDCAHFAFWPTRPLLQDLLGAALMAPSLMSYELWRLKYFNHLMCTNQLHEDLDAWHPLLPGELAAMPRWRRVLAALTLATPLKFFASVGRFLRCAEGFDLRLHPKAARPWVWASWALPIVFAVVAAPALIAASGGLGGLVTYWAGPWLAFHAWLSVLSLVQHTGPHITWAEEGLTYDHAQAAINGTVCLKLPRWLEVLLHHANHHLPAHVSISIPSYNAPAAQAYLEQRLGKYLTTARLNFNLLRNLMTAWLVYDEQQQRHLDLDEAEPLVQRCRQQQEQREQQQRQQRGQQPQAHTAAAEDATPATASSSFEPSIPLSQLLGDSNGQQHSSNGAANSSHSGGGGWQQQQQMAGSSSSSA